METSTAATGSEGGATASGDRLVPRVRDTTSRALAALRQFRTWVLTPVMVRRDARIGPDGSVGDETGWAYGLPVVKPDLTDPAIAAAMRIGATRTTQRLGLAVARSATAATRHARAREG